MNDFLESHDLGELDRANGVTYPRDGVLAVKEQDGTYGLFNPKVQIFLSRHNTLDKMLKYGWWPKTIKDSEC